jgi:peptidoglycan/xylan/chitin deacetylase (PgdA/CDA1 family)
MESALVSLTFDDGLRCQFDRAVPILDQYGFPATFFLVANQGPTQDRSLGHINDWWKIDWREDDIMMLKQLVHQGHEIGSHSVSHDLNKMKLQPDIEAHESKRLIEGWVGTNISSFCYPFYRSHAFLADAVTNAGYKQARGGGKPGVYYPPQAPHYSIPHDPTLDRFNADCRQISVSENVSEWVQPARWHVLTFHGIGGQQDGWEPISVDQFARHMAELAKLRDSGAVEIVTFKDGADRFR